MTAIAANALQKYELLAATRDTLMFRGKFTVGASGAINASPIVDDPQLTLTKNGGGNGWYDLTFPQGFEVDIIVSLYSPAKTVATSTITAYSSTAGTALFKVTNAAGTDTNPASSDEIRVQVYVKTRQ